MQLTTKEEFKKKADNNLRMENNGIFCPLCGSRILDKVTKPVCFKFCFDEAIGFHLLLIIYDGRKVIVKAASE